MGNNMMDYYFLAECLSYDPSSGILRYKSRPESHFIKKSHYKLWESSYVGRIAGSKQAVRGRHDIGYLKFQLSNYGDSRSYLAHRAAWILHYKTTPSGQIDHINGNGKDNRIANLRDVSASVNRRNSRITSLNKSGLMGVRFYEKAGKYRVYLASRYIGYFETLFSAACARKSAENRECFSYRHGAISE